MPSRWRRCSSTTESSGSCCGLAGVGWGWGGSLQSEDTSCKAMGPLELVQHWAQMPLLTRCTAGYTEAHPRGLPQVTQPDEPSLFSLFLPVQGGCCWDL